MTALSWTFVARRGNAVHVANLTRSNDRVVIALCGKSFDRPVISANGRLATCDKCRKLDDPFHASQVPFDPSTWIETLVKKRAGQPNARSALLTRDLITLDGVITPRGALLSQDLTNPTPWVDDLGITHARRSAGGRARAACGANLLGIHQLADVSAINYDRLSKARETYRDAMVDCMTCAIMSARAR